MGKEIPRTDPTQPQKKARTVLSVPSVNAMSGFTSGSSGARASTDDDKLYIAIMKYNSDGSLCNGLFEESPMYVMQLKTNANPTPLFRLKTVLGLQWQEENTKDSGSPDSEDKGTVEFFTDFESSLRTIFTWSLKKGDDVDRIGFATRRCGFYFNGGTEQAKNLLMHLDNV